MYPLLSLFEHNQTDIELGVLWWPLGVCVASAVVLYGVFLAIFRSATKASILASLAVIAFFYFGLFFSGVGYLVLWLGLFAAAAVAVVLWRREVASLTLIAGVGAVVLVLLPAIRIAAYQAQHGSVSTSDPRLWPTKLAPPNLPSGAPKRDVYVLVPDDYARLDVLKQYFHFDDSAFIRALTKRGFVISPQSRSPYSDSEMNIAAALNMDYLNGLANIVGTNSQDVRPVRRLIADNRAARLLQSLGYRYIHLDTDEVTFPVRNSQISRFAPPDSFPNLWMHQTALRPFDGKLGFSDKAGDGRFRTSIHAVFSRLNDVPREPGPKFVVFHTLLPHDPYIFGAQGQSVTFPVRSDAGLGSKLGMSYYIAQLRYVGDQLLHIVDAILARSKTPPVIVIQSDEGFQANPDTFGEAAMRQVRVKGLIALYLPGLRGKRVAEPPNTVNTLRFVFNRYFGTRYPMLRSASYPELDGPYQFEAMKVK